ncbi:hypothetical protein D9M71_796520 [compost metagenome]
MSVDFPVEHRRVALAIAGIARHPAERTGAGVAAAFAASAAHFLLIGPLRDTQTLAQPADHLGQRRRFVVDAQVAVL